ncbi:MAG TPA: ABC transporter substrate-binding protein, partial [Thermobifida alba]|nr:ABC transporter substrate-binding protein [Thermobifida alba]
MGVGTGNRPGVLTAALVAAGVLASAAGCGTGTASSDNDGDTIKLGVITAEGSSLTNYPDVTAGASAAIDAINEAGGINGKQIEYFYCNTRGEVNQAMACAREADTEGVDAIVGRVDIFSTQTMPILEAAGIPDIGNVSTGAEIDYQSPYTYPLHAGNYGAYSAMPYAFKEDGAEKMVVATVDLPIGIRQGEVAEEVAESLGLDVAPMIKVPTEGVTDYAPYAQQIKDSGADAAIVALGPAPFQAFMKAADSIGLSARIAGTAFTFGQSEAAPIGDIANGMFVTAPYPSTDDRDVPGIAEYHAQLDAAGAEDSEAIRRLA